MPIDIQDLLERLKDHLRAHPEDRRRLRAEILQEDPQADDGLSRLSRALAELAEAQRRTEQRLEALSARVEELAEAQRRTEECLQALIQRVDALASDVAVLKEDVSVLKTDVSVLKKDVSVLKNDVGELKGESLENRYFRRCHSYFGPVLAKTRIVELGNMAQELYAVLSEEEVEDVLALDLCVQGVPSRTREAGPILVGLEVSHVVDERDVERASRRASLLARLGKPVVAAVGGKTVLEAADQLARTLEVAVFEEGRRRNWNEALQAAFGRSAS